MLLKPKSFPTILILLTLFLNATAEFADLTTNILSISTSPSEINDQLRVGSLAGGTFLYIKGSGFSSRSPSSNKVTVGTMDCPVITYLTTSTQVVCQLPPSSIEQTYQVFVSVDDVRVVTCTKCFFSYTRSATPQLESVIPNAANPGDEILFYGVQRIESSLDVDFMKIGDRLCDSTNQNEFNPLTFDKNSKVALPCTVPALEAGYYEVSQKNLKNTGAAMKLPTVPISRNDNTTYDFVVVPSIDSISNHRGSSEGQIITITGRGFAREGKNQVNLGNIPCNILSESATQIQCELQPGNPSPSSQGYHAGLRWELYQGGNSISSAKNASYTPNRVIPRLSTETPQKAGDKYVEKLSGYFRAPATGNFRFYASGDDEVEVYFSKTPMNKTALEKIIDIDSSTPYKFYFTQTSQISSEIPLTQDNLYYMEIYHLEASGSDFSTVGVQVPINNPTKPTPEAQSLKTVCPTDYEILEFKMTGAQGGLWRIRFDSVTQDGTRISSSTWTRNMTYNASAMDVQNYLDRDTGFKTQVNKAYLKSDGTLTNTSTEVASIIYNVTFLTSRNGGILPVIEKNTLTGSDVSVKVTLLQTPSDPLKGNFTLSYQGNSTKVRYNAPADELEAKLRELGFTQRITVYQTGDFDHGAEWKIQFMGQGTSSISTLQATANELSGCKDPSGISVNVTSIQNGTDFEFYEVIPFELLSTADESPQVTVKSNNITATCASFYCNYTIQENDLPVITADSWIAPTITVFLANVTSNNTSDIKVLFANVECQIVSLSPFSNVYILTANCLSAEAGDYLPKVHFNGLGFAKKDSSLSNSTIDPTISTVEPSEINPNGGTVLTINGTGYPASLDVASRRNFTIKISEAPCQPISVSSTSIQCKTTNTTTTTPLALFVNNKVAVFSNLTAAANVPTISSVSPTVGNPVLKTDIQIVGTNFDSDGNNTNVFLKNNNNSAIVECLLTQADNTTVNCTLLGAQTGTYMLYLETSKGYSNPQAFEIKTTITSISPRNGSTEGGTLLTIQGGVFSTNLLHTAVFIGPPSMNVICDVVQVTDSEIKCKTRALPSSYNQTALEVVVTTRESTESLCTNNVDGCTFTYSDSVTPNITSFGASSVVPGGNLDLNGNNLESDPSGSLPIVTIDGLNCTIATNSASGITVTVPADITPSKNASVIVNIPGKGNAKFTGQKTIQVNLTIDSIAPTTGSTTGVLLTVTGTGFKTGMVVKVGGTACKIRSLSSNTVVCKATSGGEVAVDFNNFTDVKCTGCVISTLTLTPTLTPTITSVSPQSPVDASAFTLAVNGTLFDVATPVQVNLVSGTDSAIIFGGTVSSSTATHIDVNFANITSGTYNVEVASGPHLATSTGTVDVPLSVIVSSPIESSIAGGAKLTLSGFGFYGDIQKEKVSVCDLPCKVTQSTTTSISCETPAFVNTAVEAAYPQLLAPSVLKPVFTWSDAGNETNLFDSAFTTSYKSASVNCEIGLDFGDSLLGEVREIRFFPDPAISPSTLNSTIIQGSNDKANYNLVGTIDANAHDGWNTINLIAATRYRFYKVKGTGSTGKCALSELQFLGVILHNSSTIDLEALQCNLRVTVNDKINMTAGAVTYKQSKTASLTSISPQMGPTAGGTNVTLTGTGFITTVSDITVKFDDIDCAVQTANATQITCITGSAPDISMRRPSLQSDIKITFADRGNVVVNNLKYFYIDRWSEQTTWGGLVPPTEGDSVRIPAGQTILLDVSPPKLKSIVVEGALIFEDKDINLDCEYILIRNGRMQIGTWENPIQNKITITLYGNKDTAQVPDFGNKMIGLMGGILDIHGKQRSHTWTVLNTTVNAGNTSIVVQGAVDWVVGEQIVIASTEHDHLQSEARTISNITVNSPSAGLSTISFTDPLKYRHYAGVQTIDQQAFEMRAEVGLLSRNVVIQGDKDSEANLYGVQIMTRSNTGDDSSVGRISYTEIRRAGQARNLGRYPIHFNLIGNIRQSFVIGNSIHHTYNRAIAVHGVNSLKVQKNVAYWCMGHTIFIEDGIETFNVIEDNLVINTIASATLLSTDQTPASFWVTNPNNILRRNRAAGSDRHGFWFDLKDHPEGASATGSVCPNGERLGEFTDNQGHSNGRHALRIFREFIPRINPCLPYNDPIANPPVSANFTNFLGWKNMRDAVVGERLGAIRFKNIKTADNLRAGIEVSDGNRSPPDTLLVEDAWIVGISPENGGNITEYINRQAKGLITPRVDNFLAKNVHFSNFGDQMAAIGTCSNCEYEASTDSGARTSFFQGLTFSNSSRRVTFNTPFKEILIDRDGSLTGNSPSGLVTYFYDHLNVLGCVRNESVFNGLVCDSTVMVRRIVLYQAQPTDKFNSQDITVTRGSVTSVLPFRPRTNPDNSWALPFVTGYDYRLTWANFTDFNKLTVGVSELYAASDKMTTLMFNYIQYREAFEVIQSGTTPVVNITNSTSLWTTSSDTTTNCGSWYHSVSNQQLYVAINGRQRKNVDITAFQCKLNCPLVNPEEPDFLRIWSNSSHWPSGKVPESGDNVEIPANWRILLDVNSSSLNTLVIKGKLYFNDTDKEIALTAQRIWVQGRLEIGNSTKRYAGRARIALNGSRTSDSLKIGGTDVSNNVLAVTGNLSVYGAQVNYTYVRLQSPADVNATSIRVPDKVDWQVGDRILITATQQEPHQSEVRVITNISNGTISFDQGLSYYHFGADNVTKTTSYGVIDMRAEVALLSRNVIIGSSNDSNWGGMLYVGKFSNNSQSFSGRVELDSVELANLGQPNTELAGITFDSVATQSFIQRSAIRDSQGLMMRVIGSKNLVIQENVFYKSVRYQILVEEESSQMDFMNNLVIDNTKRTATEFTASLYVKDELEGKFSGNIFAGCDGQCIVARGNNCNANANSRALKNNTAHSGETGWLVNRFGNCLGINGFIGYKLAAGIQTYFRANEIQVSNIAIADSHIGLVVNSAEAPGDHEISLKDSYFGGLLLAGINGSNNSNSSYPNKAECKDMTAVYIPVSTENGKSIPPTASSLPWRKVNSNHLWESKFTVSRVTFEYFGDNLVDGCQDHHLFRSNEAASDASAVTIVSGLTLKNVSRNSTVYFDNPNNTWMGIGNCGGSFCTGIKNILVQDRDGSLFGEVSAAIPNNTRAQDNNTCTPYPKMNAYICKTVNWGLLTFESNDKDKSSRVISPVTIYNSDGYYNSLNSYMDHDWNGISTSLNRLSRFHAVVQNGENYTVNFTGSVPSSLDWQLQGAQDGEFVTIEYTYDKPCSAKLGKNGKWWKPKYKKQDLKVKVKESDEDCGSYYFDYEARKMTITLSGAPDCLINVKVTNSVRCKIRFDYDFDDFFKNGKLAELLKKLATLLKVSESKIRILGAKKGSTELDMVIDSTSEDDTAAAQTELSAIKSSLDQAVNGGEFSAFGNVLDYRTETVFANPSELTPTNAEVITETKDGLALVIVAGVIGGLTLVVGFYFACLHFNKKKAFPDQKGAVSKINFELVSQDEHIEINTEGQHVGQI